LRRINKLPIRRNTLKLLRPTRAHQPALRAGSGERGAGTDDPDQQPELRRLGRGVRRPGDRYGDPRPAIASCGDTQYPRQFVSLKREVEGRSRPPGRDQCVNRVGKFQFPHLGKIGLPLIPVVTPRLYLMFQTRGGRHEIGSAVDQLVANILRRDRYSA
jgi:hypothetical protein